MRTSLKTETNIETVYFPANLTLTIDESEAFVPRLGKVKGTGRYRTSFYHDYCWGMIAKSGKAEVRGQGLCQVLEKNDLLLLRPSQLMEFHEFAEDPFDYQWFDLHGFGIEKALSRSGVPYKGVIFYPAGGRDLLPILDDIVNRYDNDDGSAIYPIYAAWRIIEQFASRNMVQEVEQDPAIAIHRILEEGFRYRITIEEIASKLNMARSTVFKKFKAHYGISPKQYIDDLKVKYAKDLLRQTTMSIGEVSFSSGFESVQHFYLMFKRRTGKTPASFRKN